MDFKERENFKWRKDWFRKPTVKSGITDWQRSETLSFALYVCVTLKFLHNNDTLHVKINMATTTTIKMEN